MILSRPQGKRAISRSRHRLPANHARTQDVGVPTRRSALSDLPWVIALGSLAAPLIAGHGAGWPYVAGWLVFLAVLRVPQPLQVASRPDRIKWAAVSNALLFVPGFLVGGIYLVPAGLVWLGIEFSSSTESATS